MNIIGYNMKLFKYFNIIILLSCILIGQDKPVIKKQPKDKMVFSNDQSTDDYLKIYKRALELLISNYVDSINESEIILSGIKGLMNPLDPYTKLLTDQSKENYDHLRRGKYGGVGIQIGLRRDTLTVLSTFENSPAYSEGISVGDNIMMIDSTSTEGLTLKEASKLIKGEIDSTVVLHIYRSSSKQKIKFELSRSNIPIKNVPYWGVDDNGIGYIRITKFSKNSDKDFKLALKELSDAGMNSLIIDLRGNSGGLLTAAINMLDNVTERGEILLKQKGKIPRANKVITSRRAPIIDSEIPIVVLINKKSASASEIFSGTLQDLDRAIIMGQKSFGKGLVQHMYDLNDSTTLKITTAKFYLPSGRLIQKQDYLNNGFLTDGLDKRDTIFVTKNGREVYGAGGIKPDIITNKNTYSSFINALWKDKVFLTFVSDYVPKHPKIKEKLEKQSIIDKSIFNKFKKFVKEYNLDFTIEGENDYKRMKEKLSGKPLSLFLLNNYFKRVRNKQFSDPNNKKNIYNGLLREFCRVVFNEKKRIEVSLINDIEYNQAVELLLNSNEYYSRLGF